MSYTRDEFAPAQSFSVAQAATDERVAFIRRTYAHLAAAITAFVLLEAILLRTAIGESFAVTVLGSQLGWIGMMVGFMVVGMIANRWAQAETSAGIQYLGLSVYVVAEAIFFLPLLYMAANYAGSDVIPMAAITTLSIFTGITAVVFVTKKDFSFLRAGLGAAFAVAIGVIICSFIFGFQLGLLFSFLMAGLAGGYVLYYTSNVFHQYRTTQHVAASLALFSAIALMFWYILRIFMSRD